MSLKKFHENCNLKVILKGKFNKFCILKKKEKKTKKVTLWPTIANVATVISQKWRIRCVFLLSDVYYFLLFFFFFFFDYFNILSKAGLVNGAKILKKLLYLKKKKKKTRKKSVCTPPHTFFWTVTSQCKDLYTMQIVCFFAEWFGDIDLLKFYRNF